ncbi:MAG: hypothetical protein R2877_00765 [Bdellovibrionota bacterium]
MRFPSQNELDKAKADLEQYLVDKEKDLSPSKLRKGWKIIADIQLKQDNTQGCGCA